MGAVMSSVGGTSQQRAGTTGDDSVCGQTLARVAPVVQHHFVNSCHNALRSAALTSDTAIVSMPSFRHSTQL